MLILEGLPSSDSLVTTSNAPSNLLKEDISRKKSSNAKARFTIQEKVKKLRKNTTKTCTKYLATGTQKFILPNTIRRAR